VVGTTRTKTCSSSKAERNVEFRETMRNTPGRKVVVDGLHLGIGQAYATLVCIRQWLQQKYTFGEHTYAGSEIRK
jgi:hypothetical protein